MVLFQGLYPYHENDTNMIPHIHPLTNISLSKLQRGTLSEFSCSTNSGFEFEPPSLDLYTQFSLQFHFFAFWVILLLQSLTIFIADKIWSNNIPESSTFWDKILHAAQKSSFPFPYTNWHQESGSCHDHLRRKRAAQQEILMAMIINLLFNMLLLVPLPIFCKIFVSIWSI